VFLVKKRAGHGTGVGLMSLELSFQFSVFVCWEKKAKVKLLLQMSDPWVQVICPSRSELSIKGAGTFYVIDLVEVRIPVQKCL